MTKLEKQKEIKSIIAKLKLESQNSTATQTYIPDVSIEETSRSSLHTDTEQPLDFMDYLWRRKP